MKGKGQWCLIVAVITFFLGATVTYWFAKSKNPITRDVQRTIAAHQIPFIGDLKDRVFHESNCPIAKDIPKGRRALFHTQRAAKERGFHPCYRCRP